MFALNMMQFMWMLVVSFILVTSEQIFLLKSFLSLFLLAACVAQQWNYLNNSEQGGNPSYIYIICSFFTKTFLLRVWNNILFQDQFFGTKCSKIAHPKERNPQLQ
jgi:hypothetical protein